MQGYNYNSPLIKVLLSTTTTSTIFSTYSQPTEQHNPSWAIVLAMIAVAAIIITLVIVVIFACIKSQKFRDLFQRSKLLQDQEKHLTDIEILQQLDQKQFATGSNEIKPEYVKCELGCDYVTRDKELYTLHEQAHLNKDIKYRHYCELCSFKSETQKSLDSHKKFSHHQSLKILM